jgi:hypothetical protein
MDAVIYPEDGGPGGGLNLEVTTLAAYQERGHIQEYNRGGDQASTIEEVPTPSFVFHCLHFDKIR